VYRFTTYIALFLLLLFTRAMVPDQLLLSLHSHAHTEHSHLVGDHNQAHVEKDHKHCPVEDLFGAPFQSATEFLSFQETSLLPAHIARYTAFQAFASNTRLTLRGPPAVA
jgi:hypothetical protein